MRLPPYFYYRSSTIMSDYLDLYDYRIRVAAMYRERNQAILSGADPVAAWERFRAVRDDLFAHHPQSALDDAQRSTFQGLPYFAYNAEMRFIVDIDTIVEPTRLSVAMNGDESMAMTTVGCVHFVVEGEAGSRSTVLLAAARRGGLLPMSRSTRPCCRV